MRVCPRGSEWTQKGCGFVQYVEKAIKKHTRSAQSAQAATPQEALSKLLREVQSRLRTGEKEEEEKGNHEKGKIEEGSVQQKERE